jgi:hypothetical protein
MLVAHATSMAWLASLTPRVSATAGESLTQSAPPAVDETATRLAIQCGCALTLQSVAPTVYELKMPQKDEGWDAEFEHEKCTNIGERPCQIPFYRKLPPKRGKNRRHR